MGTCTSTARHRQKQQQHNRVASKNSSFLDIKQPPPLPPLPPSAFPNNQHLYSIPRQFDLQLASTKPFFHPSDTNSLIQLYSTHPNNINAQHIAWMSSSTSIPSHAPARIPVLRTRLPLYHPSQTQASTSTTAVRSTHGPTAVLANDPTVLTRPMSITNRPPPPTAMQSRFGFIPRPTAPGAQISTAPASRSRSISPTSTISAHSSSSSSLASQRLMKPPANAKTTLNRSVPSPSTHNPAANPKTVLSPRSRDLSASKATVKSNLQTSTAASRMRSRTPSRTSATSLSSAASPVSTSPAHTSTTITKPDLTAVRDRYKAQKRMNFFARRTPISTANGSPMMADALKSPESAISPHDKRYPSPLTSTQMTDSKLITPPKAVSSDSTSPSSHLPSAHLSQGTRHRQRAISMLSSASAISDVLNQDALLDDDNCSLKSDDLMCDFEDTLTIDSMSKTEQTDSCSSTSLSVDLNRKPSTTINVTPTKPTVAHSPLVAKEHRSSTTAKGPTNNGSLRESLDELNRLSNRVDNTVDQEHNRKQMSRSVSLKPPLNHLPPLDDAEQITMDIESYRQVMKDVMVVKTILHQLDRLLKHSDGANMTDSMIGSFHEYHDSMVTSRRYSVSGDGSLLSSIDENSSYEDLLKEIIALRKEKEQDKQTIKLLQEQMYKYSSHTNGSS